MTLTLLLFFIKNAYLSMKQRASMLLTLKLGSFLTVPSHYRALRLQAAVPTRKQSGRWACFFGQMGDQDERKEQDCVATHSGQQHHFSRG